VWRDAKPDRSPPNNWLRSWSDQPAWTFDDHTAQYYLHCFLPEQPDLNWSNVEVRRVMAESLRFWLRRGVDGFRMDVIHLIGKDQNLPDDPVDLVAIGHVPLNDVPETHGYLREIRSVLEESPNEPVSVGEVYLLDPEAVVRYYGDGDELHLSFNFASLMTPWRATSWRDLIERTEASHNDASAWPTWVLSNHDNMRVASRLGNQPGRARCAALLLLSLRGTPFLYQGEELGMLDGEIPPERVVDPGGRDACRTPIPWVEGGRHGWPAEPWLPFAADSDQVAVAVQTVDPSSMLAFVRSLLRIRRRHRPLREGALCDLSANEDVLRFSRVADEERVTVCINFAKEQRTVALGHSSSVVLASQPGVELRADHVVLPPSSAVIMDVSA
jgi:alpha-glucosidase